MIILYRLLWYQYGMKLNRRKQRKTLKLGFKKRGAKEYALTKMSHDGFNHLNSTNVKNNSNHKKKKSFFLEYHYEQNANFVWRKQEAPVSEIISRK